MMVKQKGISVSQEPKKSSYEKQTMQFLSLKTKIKKCRIPFTYAYKDALCMLRRQYIWVTVIISYQAILNKQNHESPTRI